MQGLIYHGEDSSLIQKFESIETRDELVKHMFVTLEPGPENAIWIRSVPLKDLYSFEGSIFQVDYDTERDALILQQVQMRFWPWGRAAETLDELFREAFNDFFESLSQSGGGWFAKERDCVNRFVMGHLVPSCSPASPLKHPSQIGMEVAVKMPDGMGNRLTSPKDVVIWDSPYGTCWNSEMKPVRSPVAVLEWKCQRKTGSKQDTAEDRAWLEAFCRESLGSTGYSVFLDLDAGGVLRELTVARCSGGEWNNSWLRRPL